MRKRHFIAIFMVGFTLLLIGCGKEESKELELEDAEKIEIVSVDDPEFVISSMEEPMEIIDFVYKLQIHKWAMEDIPSTAKASYMYKLYRPETEKLLASKSKEKELQLISIITAFQDDPYIKLETKLLDFTFKVPDDVAQFLNNWQ